MWVLKILFKRNQINENQVKDLKIWCVFTLSVEQLKKFSRRDCSINIQCVSHAKQWQTVGESPMVEKIG